MKRIDIDLPEVQPKQSDFHRQAMHTAVARIMTTWPKVIADIRLCDGFPAGRGYDSSPGGGGIVVDGDRIGLTTVEAAVLGRERRVGWIAQLHDVTMAVLRAAHPETAAWSLVWDPANLAPKLTRAVDLICGRWPDHADVRAFLYSFADASARLYPDQARKGQQVDGVTVGERGNTVEKCAYCRQPVAGGQGDPIRRIDGDPYHKSPCWYTVTTSRGIHPTQRTASDEGDYPTKPRRSENA